MILERTPKTKLGQKLEPAERSFRIHVSGRLPKPGLKSPDDTGEACGIPLFPRNALGTTPKERQPARVRRLQFARLGHAVADVARVEDVGRNRGVIVQLGAEILDRGPQTLRVGLAPGTPDLAQQQIVGRHASRVDRQHAQRGSVDGLRLRYEPLRMLGGGPSLALKAPTSKFREPDEGNPTDA